MSEESNHSLILQQLLQFVQPCIVQEIVRDIQELLARTNDFCSAFIVSREIYACDGTIHIVLMIPYHVLHKTSRPSL